MEADLTATPGQGLSSGARATIYAQLCLPASAGQHFVMWRKLCQRQSQVVTSSPSDLESPVLTLPRAPSAAGRSPSKAHLEKAGVEHSSN